MRKLDVKFIKKIILNLLFVQIAFASEEPKKDIKRKSQSQNVEATQNAEKKYKSENSEPTNASKVFSKYDFTDLIEETYLERTTFPADISEMIIDYAENKFVEIARIKNESEVASIAWSPDGRKLAYSSNYQDVSIKIVDLFSGKQIKLCKNIDSGNWLNWKTNSKLLSVSFNGKIIYWDVDNNKQLAFSSNFRYIDDYSFCLLSNQCARIIRKRVVVGSLIDGNFNCFNLFEHHCILTSIAWSNDGTKLAVADKQGNISFVDPTARVLNIRCEHHQGETEPVKQLFWSHDDSKLISVSDYIITVWDFETKAVYKKFYPWDRVICAAVSPDSNFVAYSTGNFIRIWDIEKDQLLLDNLSRFDANIRCIAWSPNGKQIAAVSKETIKIWGKTFAKF